MPALFHIGLLCFRVDRGQLVLETPLQLNHDSIFPFRDNGIVDSSEFCRFIGIPRQVPINRNARTELGREQLGNVPIKLGQTKLEAAIRIIIV